jgi:hypothetical protein
MNWLLPRLSVVEVSLRLLGAVAATDRVAPATTAAPAELQVSCLGNSHTFGAGAAKGEGYPEQLQRMLRSEGRSARVMNRGLLNVNSSFVAEAFPKWLGKDRPQIVFAMVGEPNIWNRYGYWNYLRRRRADAEPAPLELLLNRAETWNTTTGARHSSTFLRSRRDPEEAKYVLAYLWLGALDMGFLHRNELTPPQREEIIDALRILVAREPSQTLAWRVLAETAHDAGDAELFGRAVDGALDADREFNFPLWRLLRTVDPGGAAIAALEGRVTPDKLREIEAFFFPATRNPESVPAELRLEMLRYYPTHHQTLTSLTHTHGDALAAEIVEWIIRMLELNPFSPNNHYLVGFRSSLERRPELRRRLDDAAEARSRTLGDIDFRALISLGKLDEDWLVSDLEQIVAAARAAGATIVVQTYPPQRMGDDWSVNGLLGRWWARRRDRNGIRFLDVGAKLDAAGSSIREVASGTDR